MCFFPSWSISSPLFVTTMSAPPRGENATDAAEGKRTNLPNALLDATSFFADRGEPANCSSEEEARATVG